MFPAETVHAEAGVVTDAVQASATVLTGEGSAVVGVDDAITTLVSLRAKALVRAVGVSASGAVSARRGHYTLVHVFVAESAGVADRASAGKVEEIRGR